MNFNGVENLDFDPLWNTKYTESKIEEASVGQFEPSSDKFRRDVLNTYREFGFVRIETNNLHQPQTVLKKIAREFGLDSAFVPPQYSEDDGLHDKFGINKIGHKEETSQSHEGFLSNEAQPVHVDGTLETIGAVPTTMMLCQSQGTAGGESRIFNSVGAFYELLNKSPELADALCSERALTRSDVDRSGTSVTGPAFGANQYGLTTRFSLDNTSEWNVTEVNHLGKAKEWMVKKLSQDSPFYTEFQLKPGELLIAANHKISHGRNGYQDKRESRRQLYRAVFKNEIV